MRPVGRHEFGQTPVKSIIPCFSRTFATLLELVSRLKAVSRIYIEAVIYRKNHFGLKRN